MIVRLPAESESDLHVTTSAPINPAQLYGESSVRRSSRPKTSLFSSVTKMPRKRSASTNMGTDASVKILKKQKFEEKKANTVLVHERRAVRDVAMGMNCILGDEMGLGKTLQENSSIHDAPHLAVCLLSVLSSWEAVKATRWLPSTRTLRFHGPSAQRTILKKTFLENFFDIVLTTYDAFSVEVSWFKSRRWTYCVLDEGHKIKNSGTQVAQNLQSIGSLYRLVLTGTPVQNNLVEVWGLLHFLHPNIFRAKTEQKFLESFDLSKGIYDVLFLGAVQKFLSVIVLRRTKSVVSVDVPPRDEVTVFIPLIETQRFWHCRLFPLARLLVLGDIYISSYLLPDAQPDPYAKGEHIVASSKMIAIDKILADVLPKGERVIIFSDFMTLRNIRFARLDGSTTRPRRNLDIKLFQREKSLFLISTQAGGLGTNLTKAQNVIMCDSSWNPQNDLQAIARAHRIGQTKGEGSVEDQMLDRLRRKSILTLKIMEGDSSSENASLRPNELKGILRKGSSALSSSNDHMNLDRFLDAYISDIVGASRVREDARDAEMKQNAGENDSAAAKGLVLSAEEEERQLLSGMAQVKCRLFEGNVVEKGKHVEDIVPKLSAQKRARNNNTVTIKCLSCQTCPRAFCEDCLPDEINDVGDVLPEYQLSNYGQTPTSFYIQCHFYDMQAKEDPSWWSKWQVEITKAEKEVNKALGKRYLVDRLFLKIYG
ncbi:P-loop containing nucleoside triphosphate hydrolase protein [Desarmillaria ectypa]|nr:P-loop containing nucleoside triphosphate hydrolase protein [Desarmillaria ectypa]